MPALQPQPRAIPSLLLVVLVACARVIYAADPSPPSTLPAQLTLQCPIDYCAWALPPRGAVQPQLLLMCNSATGLTHPAPCPLLTGYTVGVALFAPPTAPPRLLSSMHITNLTLSARKLPDSHTLRRSPWTRTAIVMVLQQAPQLLNLNLQGLDLTEVDDGMFAVPRGSLLTVDLSSNSLTQLPALQLPSLLEFHCEENLVSGFAPQALAHLPSLSTLTLNSNLLSQIDPTAFAGVTKLSILGLAYNLLSHLSADVLASLTSLTSLDVSRNRLTRLDPDVFAAQTQVTFLDVSVNGLKFVPDELFDSMRSLEMLDISDNALQTLPSNFSTQLPHLLQLDLSNNAFGSVLPMLHFKNLSFLDLSNNPPLADVSTLANFPSLQTLIAHNIAITQLPPLSPQSIVLDLGYNRITQLTPLPDNLTLLQQLSLPGNRLSGQLVLQGLPSLVALDVSANALTSVILSGSNGHGYQRLNVSYNSQLTILNVAGASVDGLDVSGTALPFTPDEVTILGKGRLIAKAMLEPSWTVASVLETLLYVNSREVLDISGIRGLENLDVLRAATAKYFAIDPPAEDANLYFVEEYLAPNRQKAAAYYPITRLPQLVITNAPTTCSLETTSYFTYSLQSDLRSFQGVIPAARYLCNCIVGYHYHDGICKRDVPWTQTPQGIALITMLVLLVLILVGIYVRRRWRKGVKRLQGELELQQYLLADAEGEVLALRRAWEIDPEDVKLVGRLDLDCPGAYGAVWRATWGDLTVAVKILHQSMLELDASTAAEFEKEAEFLMTSRHPNLVRFFGAGQMKDGAPFVVLELVARGSLRGILAKHKTSLTNAIKLQLATDVCRGMTFVHSLNALHRDLKSGNVLVTEGWRAKVADFGSIRNFFSRHGPSGGAGATTATTSLSSPTTGRSRLSALQVQQDMSLTTGVGTPLYMAPEVLRNEAYDRGADVWAFGVVVWELCTGKEPDLLEQEGVRPSGPLLVQLQALLDSGARLKAPASAPSWCRWVVDECFLEQPATRPSFSSLEMRLSAAVETERLAVETEGGGGGLNSSVGTARR